MRSGNINTITGVAGIEIEIKLPVWINGEFDPAFNKDKGLSIGVTVIVGNRSVCRETNH